MALLAISPDSIVGRIHELIGELHANGRISVADANLIYGLTWHRDLPQFFKDPDSAPLMAGSGGAKEMPAMRCVVRNTPVTVNVTGAADPEATADAVAQAIRQHNRSAG